MKKMLKSSRAAFLAAGIVCLLVVGIGSTAFAKQVCILYSTQYAGECLMYTLVE